MYMYFIVIMILQLVFASKAITWIHCNKFVIIVIIIINHDHVLHVL